MAVRKHKSASGVRPSLADCQSPLPAWCSVRLPCMEAARPYGLVVWFRFCKPAKDRRRNRSCKPSAPRTQRIKAARQTANRLPCGRAAGAKLEQLGQLLSPAHSPFSVSCARSPELSAPINCAHSALLSRTRLGRARVEPVNGI